MKKYHASYNQQNGPTFEIEAKTEIGAKRKASKRCAYGHSITLIELDDAGEQSRCVSSKEWGKKWISE